MKACILRMYFNDYTNSCINETALLLLEMWLKFLVKFRLECRRPTFCTSLNLCCSGKICCWHLRVFWREACSMPSLPEHAGMGMSSARALRRANALDLGSGDSSPQTTTWSLILGHWPYFPTSRCLFFQKRCLFAGRQLTPSAFILKNISHLQLFFFRMK